MTTPYRPSTPEPRRGSAPPATVPGGPPPRLWRSRADRVIAGVIGGIAEKYGFSATATRVLFVISTLASGMLPGMLFYAGYWAIARPMGPERTGPWLWRSKGDRVVAGVIGGLAEKLGIPSTPARVLYAIMTLMTGGIPGIVAYLLAWMGTDPMDPPRVELP